MRDRPESELILRHIGIDTYKEVVIYMRKDCLVCRAEGFEVHARVLVTLNGKSITATLNIMHNDMLNIGEASLSEYGWTKLGAKEGDRIQVIHAPPVQSLKNVRSKIYGDRLEYLQFKDIVTDIVDGHYSNIHLSSFLTACAGGHLNGQEVIHLTKAMVECGERLDWGQQIVVDKHCVGGLPGNRTTPIVVAIVSSYGLAMPKTSSRAITSPAGTADTMEVLAPVELSVQQMRRVVESEGGCIVWGGSVALSPADDLMIRVERALDLDSEGQLVASVLSKKLAAGSSHVLIDMPIGPTAKVRSMEMSEILARFFEETGTELDISVRIHNSDGIQPVGNGIGPVLEARDVLAVLKNKRKAPQDLRAHAIDLAGYILEFSPDVVHGQGRTIAEEILSSGQAWLKFQAICEAQGGMRELPRMKYSHSITALKSGNVTAIDNRRISKVAKLAGAPVDKIAGVDFHAKLGVEVEYGQPLFTVYAESPGELEYALSYLELQNDIIAIAGE